MKYLSLLFLLTFIPISLFAQRGPVKDGPVMSFEEYSPKSTLVVPENPVNRAKYPFIDVHSHQWGIERKGQVDTLVSYMDSLNLQVMVNLSGRSGELLKESVASLKGHYPKRFVLFANVDFKGVGQPGWGQRAAAQLKEDVQVHGAQGLKIYKNLGLTALDIDGQRIKTDDPRLEPVWDMCGELGIPVLIHTGEPASFFDAHDKYNERWLELKQFPRRARPAEKFPPWEEIMKEQWNMFKKHPQTKFISAHLAWLGNDLGRLGRLLDEIPNMYTEVGAVLYELGRQPRYAKEFLTKYQGRIMFGKDSWRPSEYPYYFRVFESTDEYFPYYRKRHAFWSLYGLDLDDEVLKSIYYKAALDVIPGIDRSQFPD